MAPQGGDGEGSGAIMSESSSNRDPSALQILDMAMDHLSALLALLRSHYVLCRERAPETPTEDARTHPEDGVWSDDDIPF